MTHLIFECMDEFDSSKPNLLSTEFASAFACIYHFTSTSSSMMAKLLAFIPMAASTLATLYEADSKADNNSNNDVRSVRCSDKTPKEIPNPYDFTNIFRRTPPPVPSEDGNSHGGIFASVFQGLSVVDEHHIKDESESTKDKPPVKPIKNTLLLSTKTSNDTLQESDETTSLQESDETTSAVVGNKIDAPINRRRSSFIKQKAVTDILSADSDDDFAINNEANMSGKLESE